MSFSKDSRRGDKFKRVARHFNVPIQDSKDSRDSRKSGKSGRRTRRDNRRIAEETCEILQNKCYSYNSICLEPGRTYSPKELSDLSTNIQSKNLVTFKTTKTKFTIMQTTTVDAILRLYSDDKMSDKFLSGNDKITSGKLTVLNFASAKNPGGGFLKGSEAQEESLARATGLYATIKDSPMYEANEKDNRKCLYQEYLIYSYNVPVFRNSKDNLIDIPLYVNIISVPAVNEREALRKRVSKDVIDATRLNRMDNFLAVLAANNDKRIILGAWGCGVFGGNFSDVLDDYHHLLVDNGKYKDVFDEVIFAVIDDDDYTLLKESAFFDPGNPSNYVYSTDTSDASSPDASNEDENEEVSQDGDTKEKKSNSL